MKFHAHKPGSVVLGGCPTTRTLGPAQVDAAARGMILCLILWHRGFPLQMS